MKATLLRWLRTHQLHFIGLLFILSTPVVAGLCYCAFCSIANWLDLGFWAMAFFGALGIIAGGVVGASGFMLLIRGIEQLRSQRYQEARQCPTP